MEFAGVASNLSPGTPYDQAANICKNVFDLALAAGDLRTAAKAVRGEGECFRRMGKINDCLIIFAHPHYF